MFKSRLSPLSSPKTAIKTLLYSVLLVTTISIFAKISSSPVSDVYAANAECTSGSDAARWTKLDQGWDEQQSQLFWFTGQGSNIMPGASNCNPDGLAIGLTLEQKTQMLGMSCAACHTQKISYQQDNGQQHTVLIDGGSANLNLYLFVSRLIEAVVNTLSDSRQFERFIENIADNSVKTDPILLADKLSQVLLSLRAYLHSSSAPGLSSAVDYPGYGRLDAIGSIYNRITVEALGIAANFHPANARVSFPYLWGTPQSDTVQWNGNAPNLIIWGPLARNAGEVVGVFGELNLIEDPDLMSTGYELSANISNLIYLENSLKSLRSPSWPDIFGELDASLLVRGKQLYQQNCVNCHTLVADQSLSYNARLVSVEKVKTDPTLLQNFYTRTAQSGVLAGKKQSFVFQVLGLGRLHPDSQIPLR